LSLINKVIIIYFKLINYVIQNGELIIHLKYIIINIINSILIKKFFLIIILKVLEIISIILNTKIGTI